MSADWKARAEQAEADCRETADRANLWETRAGIAEAALAEVRRERDEWREHHDRVDHRAFALAQERDELREALSSIAQWADAYPLDIFPEPDLKKARTLLEAGGQTLDAISTSAMRHVVKGVGAIARAALEAKP